MSFIDDLNNLDPNNPGAWPLPVQLLVMAVVFVLILVGGWYLDTSKQREQLAAVEVKEREHKDTFEQKQKQAANLKALKEQMKEMEQSFGDMLRQLPNKTEVPGLIVEISQTGLAAGLEFDLFKPLGNRPQEFYSQLPIDIKVRGNYHQLGEFVSGIAALPRIVTTHGIKITKGREGELTMSARARTYTAVQEEG